MHGGPPATKNNEDKNPATLDRIRQPLGQQTLPIYLLNLRNVSARFRSRYKGTIRRLLPRSDEIGAESIKKAIN